MEQNKSELKNDDFCKLKTTKVLVEENCLNSVLKEIFLINEKMLIITSQKHLSLVYFMRNKLKQLGKELEIICVDKLMQITKNVENILYKNYKIVVSVGDDKVVNVAKYYSFINNCELILFIMGECLDYTFSKFARLSNGCFYNFYVTKEPKNIFVDINSVENINLIEYFIKSKYIAIFDNVLRECVYKKQSYKKEKDFIKKTIRNFIISNDCVNSKNKKSCVWALIRLGLAMSYFEKTECFFGGDKLIVDMLQLKIQELSYLEAEVIASRLINNLYLNFFKFVPKRNILNLEIYLNKLSGFLNVPFNVVVKNIADYDLMVGNSFVINRFNGYYPYLKAVLKKCLKNINLNEDFLLKNITNKYNLDVQIIKDSFLFASACGNTPCLLHIFSAFGYLEKLL